MANGNDRITNDGPSKNCIGILLDKCGINYTEEQLEKLEELVENLGRPLRYCPRKIKMLKTKLFV